MDTAESHLVGKLILDIIGEQTDLSVAARRVVDGWLVSAWRTDTGERWVVRAESVYEAACVLAERVGFDLDC